MRETTKAGTVEEAVVAASLRFRCRQWPHPCSPTKARVTTTMVEMARAAAAVVVEEEATVCPPLTPSKRGLPPCKGDDSVDDFFFFIDSRDREPKNLLRKNHLYSKKIIMIIKKTKNDVKHNLK